MGNSESANPVRNMDKRTARREYRNDFSNAIKQYRHRAAIEYDVQQQRSRSQSRPSSSSGGGCNIDDSKPWTDGNIRVFVRKRPIFSHETAAFEFDVATCLGDNSITIHDARMHNDMKRQIMHHHQFQFDRVFSERASNEQVYAQSAQSLVQIACGGGYSTCLVYGQTGKAT